MRLPWILLGATLSTLSGISSAQAVQEDKFLGSGIDSDDEFGSSVAIDGTISVVGAYGDTGEEAAFVFRQSGTNWVEEAKFVHPMGFPTAEFGSAVDVSGQVVVVGASRDNGVVANTGAAYVYRFDGATWSLEATLIAIDGDTNDGFARSVAVDGDVIVCSARGHRISGVLFGAAYLYRHDGAAWNLESKIVGPAVNPSFGLSWFGEPVAVDGDVACVGAPYFSSSSTSGRVFVYRNSGSSWSEEAVLSGSAATINTYFAVEVDISGDAIVVGDVFDNSSRGSAYVFRQQGTTWSEEARLVLNDLDPGDDLGRRAALGTDVLLLGIERDEDVCIPGSETGSVVIFGYDGSKWRWEDTLCAADAAAGDRFGGDVAIDGLLAIVGAQGDGVGSTGAAYVFQLDRDSDGDGLFDSWETQGIPIPGGANLYALPGADPQHKNLYVEVDAMDAAGLAPPQSVLGEVVTVFADSPTPNPDGNDGIDLHIEHLEWNLPTMAFPNAFADFDAMKNTWFGSPAERADPDAINILQAKRLAFRYCVFAQSYSGSSSSGLAELGGNDCMVTLGAWPTVGGTGDQKKGTFLHEFGHNLGLRHGGAQPDPVDQRYNYKPNYYSVMNYTWQVPRPWNTPGSWPFDYSRYALPNLDESNLDEGAGLGSPFPIPPSSFSVPYNSEPVATQPPKILYALMGLGYPVDWGGDGAIGPATVQRDVNRIPSSASATPDDVLEGHDDWSNLSYNFRNDSDFEDGVHLDTTLGQELDLALSQELDALPPPVADLYCEGKLNSDGCVPSMSFSGVPSTTNPAPFLVQAQDVTASSSGFLVYGLSPAEIPYRGGFICIAPPWYYTANLNSGGAGACGGSFSIDLNALIQGAASPASLVGLQVFCQYYYNDAGDPFGAGLTNALRFTIQP
jgi:hypothetical protein